MVEDGVEGAGGVLGRAGFGGGGGVGPRPGGGVWGRAGFGGEAGFGPATEAAVEDVNVLCAEGAEHPPGSGGGEDAFLLVDDDGAGVADAEGGHAAGEVFC